MVALLLADERLDPNMADKDGWTALMDAALNGHALSSAYPGRAPTHGIGS